MTTTAHMARGDHVGSGLAHLQVRLMIPGSMGARDHGRLVAHPEGSAILSVVQPFQAETRPARPVLEVASHHEDWMRGGDDNPCAGGFVTAEMDPRAAPVLRQGVSNGIIFEVIGHIVT